MAQRYVPHLGPGEGNWGLGRGTALQAAVWPGVPLGAELQGLAPPGWCPDSICWGWGSSPVCVPLSRFLRLSRADRRCGGCCVLSMAELIYRQTNTHCYSKRRFPSDSFPFF